MKILNLALCCCLLVIEITGAVAQSQSYDQFAPKPVPTANGYAKEPEPSTNLNGDPNEVLLKVLKEIVFVGRPEDIIQQGMKPGKDPIVIIGLMIPGEKDLRSLVAPFTKGAFTRGKLSALISLVILHYRAHDRPIVDVIVPQQEITQGVLQVLIIENHLGTMSVSGTHWFAPDEIQVGFRIKPGDAISATDMQEDLTWVNQNPFHTTDIVYQPGKSVGLTDVDLQTKDRFPARFYAGYEDSGNTQTGFDRYLVGVNWGDAWDAGLGHQLNYQYTTSGNFRNLIAHSGSYIIPMPWWHHTLTFFGDYIQTEGHLPPVISVSGLTYQGSARYTMPLPDWGAFKSTFGLGIDYKYNRNGLEFGSVPIAPLPYEVLQGVFSYDASMRDPYGITNFDAQVYFSPGGLTGLNNDPNFYSAHTDASSRYAYATLEMTRLTKLPFDFSLFMRMLFQFSNTNLAPSEQLGFGGYDTIRGYDEHEVISDEGYISSVEIRSPTLSLGDALHWKGVKDELQFLTFWDYGASYNHIQLPGEPNEINLSSVGVGFRYSLNTYLSMRGDYGCQLVRTGLDKQHGGRGDLSIVLSY